MQKLFEKLGRKILKISLPPKVSCTLKQCFSTTGMRPVTGTWRPSNRGLQQKSI